MSIVSKYCITLIIKHVNIYCQSIKKNVIIVIVFIVVL